MREERRRSEREGGETERQRQRQKVRERRSESDNTTDSGVTGAMSERVRTMCVREKKIVRGRKESTSDKQGFIL